MFCLGNKPIVAFITEGWLVQTSPIERVRSFEEEEQYILTELVSERILIRLKVRDEVTTPMPKWVVSNSINEDPHIMNDEDINFIVDKILHYYINSSYKNKDPMLPSNYLHYSNIHLSDH